MVVVGAGHAGGRAAHALRSNGWDGPVTLVGAEDIHPYERPPLSKSILTGERTVGQCRLFEEGLLERHDIDHLRGVCAVAIRREERRLELSDGRSLPYDRLLIAPGARPRPLPVPGADLAGVSFLRTAADAEQLGGRLRPGTRLVVVGGGLIGLEVAASALSLGCAVTVVETGPRVMMRAVPEEIALRVFAHHEAAGVTFRLGRKVTAILGEEQVHGVRLDDGGEIACEAVLVSIGVSPRVELAEAAGLAIDNGICVDRHLRTEDPYIFAAGDACAFEDAEGGRTRLECWKNAEEQARVAARNMLGAAETYDVTPWMWSDQYDRIIQIAGYPDRGERPVIRACADGSLLVYHFGAQDRLVAASGFGSVREVSRGVRVGQMMIERGISPSPAALGDITVDLKSLLTAVAA